MGEFLHEGTEGVRGETEVTDVQFRNSGSQQNSVSLVSFFMSRGVVAKNRELLIKCKMGGRFSRELGPAELDTDSR